MVATKLWNVIIILFRKDILLNYCQLKVTDLFSSVLICGEKKNILPFLPHICHFLSVDSGLLIQTVNCKYNSLSNLPHKEITHRSQVVLRPPMARSPRRVQLKLFFSALFFYIYMYGIQQILIWLLKRQAKWPFLSFDIV